MGTLLARVTDPPQGSAGNNLDASIKTVARANSIEESVKRFNFVMRSIPSFGENFVVFFTNVPQ